MVDFRVFLLIVFLVVVDGGIYYESVGWGLVAFTLSLFDYFDACCIYWLFSLVVCFILLVCLVGLCVLVVCIIDVLLRRVLVLRSWV